MIGCASECNRKESGSDVFYSTATAEGKEFAYSIISVCITAVESDTAGAPQLRCNNAPLIRRRRVDVYVRGTSIMSSHRYYAIALRTGSDTTLWMIRFRHVQCYKTVAESERTC